MINSYLGRYGIWDWKVISKIPSGNYNENMRNTTWRRYASNNMKGGRRVSSKTSQNFVLGYHYEHLDKNWVTNVSWTSAAGCNLTSW